MDTEEVASNNVVRGFNGRKTIDNDGGNDYEIPHMGKDQLERQG